MWIVLLGAVGLVAGLALVLGIERKYARPILAFVVLGWRLVTMVIAVRQALDYASTWRTVGVVLIAAIPYVILTVVVTALIGGGVAS